MGTQGIRRAIDISNWTTRLSEADWACLKSKDYTTVIVGASYEKEKCRQHLIDADAHDFRIEVYGWVRHPLSTELLDNAIWAANGLPVERFWLDVEDEQDARGVSVNQLHTDIKHAIQYVKAKMNGIPVGIYTGPWFWTADRFGVETFGVPLWIAIYNDPQTYNVYDHICGGWTADDLVMWQYSSNGTCAINCDLNLVLKGGGIRMYTDEQIDAKIGALLANAMNNGADILKNRALINEIGRAFFDHVSNHGQTAVSTTSADLKTLIEKAQAELDELTTRVKQAGTALNG